MNAADSRTAAGPRSVDRISVAMTSCNSHNYLPAMLDSVGRQTRLPDELVICDDVSVDDTPEIVDRFAAGVSFPVRFVRNERNLGVTKNFEKSIGLCGGQVVVVGQDDDDVWVPHKLARIEAALAERPAAAFVFTDAEVVDNDLRPLGYRMWQATYVGPRQLRRIHRGGLFDILLTHNICTGATMAFRSEYRDLIIPIHPGWVHDGWIALLLSAVADYVAIEQPLIRYRKHPGQRTGVVKPSLHRQYRHASSMGHDFFAREAGNYAAALARLSGQDKWPGVPGAVDKLRAKVDHCRVRLRMREGSRLRRLPLILGELFRGRYFRYSINWKAVPQDLFL